MAEIPVTARVIPIVNRAVHGALPRIPQGAAAPDGTLADRRGRRLHDLRISITDRCNFRCTYCMPHDFNKWLPSETLLTTNELVKVIEIAVSQGITEVRLTGGEPLLRPDIVEIVARISALENAPELSMTTNGVALAKVAKDLAKQYKN